MTDTLAAIWMGGLVSEWFDVHVGVRQACVIAPFLFTICFQGLCGLAGNG